jgi:DNA mismatch repair protein MutS
MELPKLTPMMQQYLSIKERHRDAILFFRLGDFYEMFFDDAHTAAKILDIALTSRNKNEDAAVPLCGVPYHSAEPYIQKLLDAGHKVAVCEQIEDPAIAKGVVKREVVRVITPGTVTAAEALDARGNNFLVALCRTKDGFGLAATDITTGEFRCTALPDEAALLDELGRIQPSEALVPAGDTRLRDRLYKEQPVIHYTAVADETFSPAAEFAGQAADGVRFNGSESGVRAASAICAYLKANAADSLKLLRDLETYRPKHRLVLDESTRASLELVRDFRGERGGSLLFLLDHTVTPMGARRLRQWLLYPLIDPAAITARLESVQELVENFSLRQDLRVVFGSIRDLERLAGRAVAGSADPKELIAIKETLLAVAQLRIKLTGAGATLLLEAREGLTDLDALVDLIARAIVDDPPLATKEGGFIRTGYDAELDEIAGLRSHAREWIRRYECEERRRSGIQSLKVRYNRVFGYYIEITKSHLRSVPGDYLRKQTLANGERYITPELKEYEAKVLNAESLMEKLELALLVRVREQVAAYYPQLKAISNAVATLDVLAALAEVAQARHFSRPLVDGRDGLSIREARHPVVEAALGRGAFVANDCVLEPEDRQIMLLTGPNMAGKSTYMRQIALIVIMAQMGGFVPATAAHIGVVDRIFTRIGAADALARGESTFMVEMKETANILAHASRRSLILLDEVGRGTSTFDGISIAWAVAEALHDAPERPRTLFATHYHELTGLSETKERIRNYHFAVKEWHGEIIFLRNLLEGATSHSHGIHVARLAGMPAAVIQRAKEILAGLENSRDRQADFVLERPGRVEAPAQMRLFQISDSRIREQLHQIDVTMLTPIEAMNVLHGLVEEAKK